MSQIAGVRILADARFQVESGASNDIRELLNRMLRVDGLTWNVVAHTTFDGFPETANWMIVPARPPLREFLWTQIALPRLVRRTHAEVLLCLKLLPPLRAGVPVAYRAGSAGYFTGEYPSSLLEHLYWRHYAGFILRRIEHLFVLSEENRDVYVRVVGVPRERISVVYNGVGAVFRPISPSLAQEQARKLLAIDRPYFLCVGNMFPVKNHSTVVRAYASLKRLGGTHPMLVIAGDDRHPYAREVRREIAALGLEGEVRLLGRVDQNTLAQLYNGAICLVHPSIHEGFGNAVVEAMACGLPVICSRRGALPELCLDAALYLDPPEDDQGLARLMEQMVGSSELRQQLRQRALERARSLSWERAANAITEVCWRLSQRSAKARENGSRNTPLAV